MIIHKRIRGRKWMKIRNDVFMRDGYECVLCPPDHKRQAKECDHIVPLHKGGSNEMSNLRSLCIPCHHKVTTGNTRITIGADGWPVQ